MPSIISPVKNVGSITSFDFHLSIAMYFFLLCMPKVRKQSCSTQPRYLRFYHNSFFIYLWCLFRTLVSVVDYCVGQKKLPLQSTIVGMRITAIRSSVIDFSWINHSIIVGICDWQLRKRNRKCESDMLLCMSPHRR